MPKTFDGLVSHLIEHVALTGVFGASPSDFIEFVRLYYVGRTSHSESSVRVLEEPTVRDVLAPKVDQAFLEYVWDWLLKSPSICAEEAEENPSANVQASLERSTDGIDTTTSTAELTSRVTNGAVQDAAVINGVASCQSHDVDGEGTILAPNHSHSTSASMSDGFEGFRFKHLRTRIYADQESMWPVLTDHAPDPYRVRPLDFQILSLIAAHGPKGILQHDLVRISGQDKRSVPHRTDKLKDGSYIFKESIFVWDRPNRNRIHTSLCTLSRFAQEPEHEAEIQRLQDEASKKILNKIRKRKRSENTLEDVAEQGVAVDHEAPIEDLRDIPSGSRTSQWDPDRFIGNQIYDVVHQHGIEGATMPQIRYALFGHEFRKPIEFFLGRIVDAWQVSQPLHLRHLGIVRDTILRDRSPAFIQYTVPSFKALVDTGKASWEAIVTIAPDVKVGKQVSAAVDDTAKVDAFGFPELENADFQGPNNDSSLAESARCASKVGVVLKSKPSSLPRIDDDASKEASTSKQPIKRLNRPPKKPEQLSMHRRLGRPRKYPLSNVPDVLGSMTLSELHGVQRSRQVAEKYQRQKLVKEIERRVAEGEPAADVALSVLIQFESNTAASENSSMISRIRALILHEFANGPEPPPPTKMDLPPQRKGRVPKAKSTVPKVPNTKGQGALLTTDNGNGPDSVKVKQANGGKKRKRKEILFLYAPSVAAHSSSAIPSKQRTVFNYHPSIAAHSGLLSLGHNATNAKRYKKTQVNLDGTQSVAIDDTSTQKTKRKYTRKAKGPATPSSNKLTSALQDKVLRGVMSSRYFEQLQKLDRRQNGVLIARSAFLKPRGDEPRGLPRQQYQLAVFRLEQLKATPQIGVPSDMSLCETEADHSTLPSAFYQNPLEENGHQAFEEPRIDGASEQDGAQMAAAASVRQSSPDVMMSSPVNVPASPAINSVHTNFMPQKVDLGDETRQYARQPEIQQGMQLPATATQRSVVTPQAQDSRSYPLFPAFRNNSNVKSKRSLSVGSLEARGRCYTHHPNDPRPPNRRSYSAAPRLCLSASYVVRLQDNEACDSWWEQSKIDEFNASRLTPIEGQHQVSEPKPTVRNIQRSHTQKTKRSIRKEIGDDSGKVKVNRLSRTGGSTAMIRRNIVMELVHRANGVCPGHHELNVPFTIEWTQRGHRGQPERSTVKTAVKALCASKQLRTITFAFKTPEGLMKTKSILTLFDIKPTDPRVKKLQQDIEKAGNRVYLPKEWMFQEDDKPVTVEHPKAPDGRPLNPRRSEVYNRMEYHQRQFRKKEIEETLVPTPKKRYSTLKRLLEADSRRLNPEMHDDDEETLGPRGNKAVKRLGTLNRLSRIGYVRKFKVLDQPPRQTKTIPPVKPIFHTHVFQDPQRHTWHTVIPYQFRPPARRGRQAHDVAPSQLYSRPPLSQPRRQWINSIMRPSTTRYLNRRRRDATRSLLNFSIYRQSRRRSSRAMAWHVSGSYISPYADLSNPSSGLLSGKPHRSGLYTGMIPSYMNPKQVFHAATGTYSSIFQGIVPTILSTETLGILPKYRKEFKEHWSFKATAEKVLIPQFWAEVENLELWELTTPEAENLQFNGWPFIHYHFPHPHKSVSVETGEVFMENSKMQFVNRRTGRLVAKRAGVLLEDEIWTDQANLLALGHLRRVNKRKRDELSSSESDSSESDYPRPTLKSKRRRRQQQPIRSRDTVEEYRLIRAVIAVRCLTGGHDKRCNWDLVDQAYVCNLDRAALRAKWNHVRVKYRNFIEVAESFFQEHFAKAYSDGVLPLVDFDDLESYPWEKLDEWFSQTIRPESFADNKLPSHRSRLTIIDDLDEDLGEEFNQYYELEAFASTRVRKDALNGQAWTVAYSNAIHQDTPREERLEVCRTLIRANCAASRKVYDPALAQIELSKFTEQEMSTSLRSLQDNKVLSQRKTGSRKRVRRIYSLHAGSLAQLQKTIPMTTFERAVMFKGYLDKQLANNGSVVWSKHAQDGDMVVFLNLLSTRRITLRTADVPLNKWGHTGEGYETRQMDKTKLYCNAIVSSTSIYVDGNPILPLPPIPCSHFDEPNTRRRRIPLWYDIHGNFLKHLWKKAVAAIMCIITTRPGVSFSDISVLVVPMLEKWELGWMLEWTVKANAVEEYDSSGGMRYKTKEWWWMVLDGRGSEEEAILEIADGTWPSLAGKTDPVEGGETRGGPEPVIEAEAMEADVMEADVNAIETDAIEADMEEAEVTKADVLGETESIAETEISVDLVPTPEAETMRDAISLAQAKEEQEATAEAGEAAEEDVMDVD